MEIFDGKKVKSSMLDGMEKKIREKNLRPGLAIILVGDDEASKIYTNLKKRDGESIKMKVEIFPFDKDDDEKKDEKKKADVDIDEILAEIDEIIEPDAEEFVKNYVQQGGE